MQFLRCSVLVIMLSAAPLQFARATTFTSLDFPGATYTELSSIDGNNIVGYYQDAAGAQHGFLYDGVNWTTLDVPFPRSPDEPFLLAYDTRAFGISGSRIVGWYLPGPHGFLFDGTTWTPLDYPGSTNGSNQAVDGNSIVGVAGSTGFLYDGATWTPLAYPGSLFTNPLGIDGNRIVGFYESEIFPAPRHGFVYDGMDWDALNYPGSVSTEPHGIDGNNIVGTWWDATQSHGFIYDGASWQSFDYPSSVGTIASDISGNRIVGTYFDVTGNPHNFLATTPEPQSLSLTGIALTCVLAAQRGRARRARPGQPSRGQAKKRSLWPATSLLTWLMALSSSMALPAQRASAVDFVFQYDDPAGFGFFDPALGASRRAAMEASGDVWGPLIRPSYFGEEIVVRAKFDPLDPGDIAKAKPHYFYSDFGSSSPQYQADTNYPKALANHLAGRDLAPGRHEIDVTVNESATLYYGLDGMPPTGQFDFVTVAAHELGHGLGFFKSFQEDGDFGILGDGMHYNPDPACDGCLPTPYDRFLSLGPGGPTLLSLPDDDARKSALISNNVFWNGPSGIAGDGGTAPKIAARAPFDAGSSTSHLDQSMDIPTRPVLMPPFYPGVRQSLSAVERGILRDIGWSISVTPSTVTWTGLGFDNAASTAANWSPATPLPGDTVAFGPSPRTDVDMNLDLGTLQGISFLSAAPAYALRFRSTINLNMTGGGIANASSQPQSIYLESSIRDDPSADHVAANMTFLSNSTAMTNATAGEAEYWLSGGGTKIGGIAPPHGTLFLDRHPGASIVFRNSSDGGSGLFEIEGGVGDGAPGAAVTFRDSSTAGSAEYRNRGGLVGPSLPVGAVAGGFGGETRFENTADAGTATFHNYGQAEHRFGSAGFTTFMDNASAGITVAMHGTFHNHGSTINAGQGGVTRFFENSTAGAASITNHADGANGGGAALTLFLDSSNAGTATIENEGSSAQLKAPGRTEFRGNSSAASATINSRGFITVGDLAGRTLFYDDTTAATATLRTFSGYSDHGRIEFHDRSTAADAHIIIDNEPMVTASHGGYVTFFNDSTAARSEITLRSGSAGFGGLTFYNNAKAADAQIVTEDNSGRIAFYGNSIAGDSPTTDTPETANFSLGRGSGMSFYDQSKADDAIITVANGAFLHFNLSSSAGQAQIAAAGSSAYPVAGALINFNSTSTVNGATVVATGGTAPLAEGANVSFINGAHAGNSTITLTGGTNGGGGARLTFNAAAKGDTARLIAHAGATVDFFDQRIYGDTAVGSIEGAGAFWLRGSLLTVGSRNLSTTVSGPIIDHPTGFVTGGRLTKVGTGTLTLAGVNTYSGATTVNAGTLRVDGSLAGPVVVNSGGTLIGHEGAIPAGVTLNSGGVYSPGASPGTMTIGGLTMNPGSTLNFELGLTRDHIVLTGNGNVSLDGILNISLLDGFLPTPGQSFALFEGALGSVTGAFDVINGPLFNGLTFDVMQNASSVMLQVVESDLLPGDFNHDGVVSGADLTNWRNGFGASGFATHTQGDADGDANVDGADFLVWQRQLGSSSSAAAAATIPEPRALVLVLLALAAPIRRRCMT